MKSPRFILASQSPRRRQLLAQLIPSFEIVSSEVEERMDMAPGGTPEELSEWNADLKAVPISEMHPDAVVLAADTLVFLQGKPLGKPKDMEEARRTLELLSGHCHQVVTGLCLIQKSSHRKQLFSDRTTVCFRDLTPQIIDAYLDRVHVLDKAGSYAIQEQGELLVERVEGSMSNVVGLPLETLSAVLEFWGFCVSTPTQPFEVGGDVRQEF